MRSLILGILFILGGLPFFLEKVKPNGWAGFRTPKTLSNPEIWYAANKVMGGDFIIVGVLLMFIGAALLTLSRNGSTLPIRTIDIASIIVLGVLAVIHSFWRLSQM